MEKLLALVAAWRKATDENVLQRCQARLGKRRSHTELIAELKLHLAEDKQEFIALRDPLPPEVEARVAELAISADDAAKDELAALARQFHWRRRDMEEMCSALHISRREGRKPVMDPTRPSTAAAATLVEMNVPEVAH